MKVTYNWLKDFVEIKISPKALAERLTMAGLEVTSLEEKGGDFIFEIEVTSNRPDWLSVIGIAREVAAITGRKLKWSHATRHTPHVKNVQRATCNVQPVSIRIEDKKDCPLYTAKIVRDVKVGPSPGWLKERLELIGCRSVNNIVDITNYVLFEWGEPLHAFDLDKLKGNTIVVRRGRQAEKITTIDREARALNPDMLVIADKDTPVAVAGVMGSLDAEVTDATKNILLEAAVFNPIVVRRGRRSLGIQSDSSYRFERGINLEIVESASSRAAQLIQELAAGRCVLAKGIGLTRAKTKSIALELSEVNRILGLDIPVLKIKKILNSLGFNAKLKTKSQLMVRVPSHRPDVKLGVDLIEEVARIHGFENVSTTQPLVKPRVSLGETRDTVFLIKNILVGLGLSEVITYSLMDKDLLRSFGMYGGFEAIEILNPLNAQQEILRPGLIPALTACVAYNLNQKLDYINIFEIAKVFSQTKGSPREQLKLGIALCGAKSFLVRQGLIKDSAGFLHLKGILDTVFLRLGIRDYQFSSRQAASKIIITTGGEAIGEMVKLEGSVLDKLDIKNKEIFVLELALDKLLFSANLNRRFFKLPVYPGISRDISMTVREEAAAGDILETIKGAGRPLLRDVRVTDYYKGKQIPSGFKGLTISCLYRSDERTLTEAEISPLHSKICNLLTEKFGVQIR